MWWPIQGGSARKGYLSWVSGIWKAKGLDSWRIWKSREICHCCLWKDLKGLPRAGHSRRDIFLLFHECYPGNSESVLSWEKIPTLYQKPSIFDVTDVLMYFFVTVLGYRWLPLLILTSSVKEDITFTRQVQQLNSPSQMSFFRKRDLNE